MAHHTARSAYRDLADRINRFPQGAPPGDLLFAILKLLFSEREAALVARLPIRPFTAADAAARWRMPEADAQRSLDALAERAILLDVEGPSGRTYVLPPPMAGFFEFSMMRVRQDIDQQLLAELFYQYLNVEEEFIRDLFVQGETHLGRVYVNEQAVPPNSRCTCSTTSGPARSSRRPTTSASGPATAATRCGTSGAPARRLSTSA